MDIHLLEAWSMMTAERGSQREDSLYDMYYQISTAIFDYRVKHKLSQKKVAEKLGVTQRMVAKLESGDYKCTIEQLWEVANQLGFAFSIQFEEIDQEEYSVFLCPEDQYYITDYEISYLALGS